MSRSPPSPSPLTLAAGGAQGGPFAPNGPAPMQTSTPRSSSHPAPSHQQHQQQPSSSFQPSEPQSFAHPSGIPTTVPPHMSHPFSVPPVPRYPPPPPSPSPGSAGDSPTSTASSMTNGGQAGGLVPQPYRREPTLIQSVADINDIYQMNEKLGSGYTAVVFDAVCRRTNQQHAIKCIHKTRQKLVANESYFRDIYDFIVRRGHPNLVKIREVLEDPEHFYIVMEKCKGPDLVEFVLSFEPGGIPEADCKRIMKNILAAVRHLHEHRLLHRDIKLDNVIFQDRPRNGGQVVLLDFDMCMFIDRADSPKTVEKEGEISVVGTREYMAPECYKGQYTQASDLWGCGVILYVLIDGHFPFDVSNCKSNREVRRVLRQGVKFEDAVVQRFPAATDLVSRLLTYYPNDRLSSAQEALDHPWFGPTMSPPESSPVDNPYVVVLGSPTVGDGVVSAHQQPDHNADRALKRSNRSNKTAQESLASSPSPGTLTDGRQRGYRLREQKGFGAGGLETIAEGGREGTDVTDPARLCSCHPPQPSHPPKASPHNDLHDAGPDEVVVEASDEDDGWGDFRGCEDVVGGERAADGSQPLSPTHLAGGTAGMSERNLTGPPNVANFSSTPHIQQQQACGLGSPTAGDGSVVSAHQQPENNADRASQPCNRSDKTAQEWLRPSPSSGTLTDGRQRGYRLREQKGFGAGGLETIAEGDREGTDVTDPADMCSCPPPQPYPSPGSVGDSPTANGGQVWGLVPQPHRSEHSLIQSAADINDIYQMGEEVGSGHTGKVFDAVCGQGGAFDDIKVTSARAADGHPGSGVANENLGTYLPPRMVLGDELMDEILQEDCPHLAQLDSQSLRDYQHRTIAPLSMAEHKKTMAHRETRHPQTSSAAGAAVACPRKGGAFDDIRVTTVATEGLRRACTEIKGATHEDVGSGFPYREPLLIRQRGRAKGTNPPDRPGSLWGFFSAPRKDEKEDIRRGANTEDTRETKKPDRAMKEGQAAMEEVHAKKLQTERSMKAKGTKQPSSFWGFFCGPRKGETKDTKARANVKEQPQGGSGVFRRKIPTASRAVLTYATTYPPPHTLPPVRVPWAHGPLDERDVMHLPRFTAAQELHTRQQLTSSVAIEKDRMGGRGDESWGKWVVRLAAFMS
ncbi:unnamed protein product [Vitrella brassicaformis CCMP3155]|uniref:Protein kinase domain-containing protein n=1 Tax=Vitrella brassicaformis (strain CCMP3155) TaxID=1169540 RepID=A0A0G4EI99_VITBC|nr:unnamed protein product [Vitrella brassicaformis CCMP3155]|eukprot:CEL95706.1 unnamed protein product [Vitrella brassicaformis CCMP3155]